jgi:hypothetical protein
VGTTAAEIDGSGEPRRSIRQTSTIASDTAYTAQSEAARNLAGALLLAATDEKDLFGSGSQKGASLWV